MSYPKAIWVVNYLDIGELEAYVDEQRAKEALWDYFYYETNHFAGYGPEELEHIKFQCFDDGWIPNCGVIELVTLNI